MPSELRRDWRQGILRLPGVDAAAQLAVTNSVTEVDHQPDYEPDEKSDPGQDGKAQH